jgi:hypothetical protein
MLAALDDDMTKRRPPSHGKPLNSEADVKAYIERQRRMTPRERLEEARDE